MSACCSVAAVAVRRTASRWKRLGQRRDGAWHGGREHQRAPFFRRGSKDEFEVLAEAEVEHFVGLVEHHGLHRAEIERAARDVIAQPSGCADDDMRAALQRPRSVRASMPPTQDAMTRAGVRIEPVEFALHLQGQFAGRRDHQPERQRRQARSGRRGRAASARWRGRRPPSCPSRSALKPAGRRRARQAPAWLPGRESGDHNRERPAQPPVAAPWMKNQSWVFFCAVRQLSIKPPFAT
jgi:hypothetical protein